MQALRNAALLFTNPAAAFQNAREHKRWALIALGLAFLSSALLWLYYYQQVDMQWLQDTLLSQAGIPAEEQDTYRKLLDPTAMLVSGITGAWAGHIVLVGLYAAYLKLICRVDSENPHGYFAWVAFSLWVFLPSVVADGISGLYLLLSQQPLLPQQLNITTVNGLLLELPPSHPWFSYFEMFSLMGIWYIALATIGLTVWTRFDRSHALVIAALPFVLLFLVWGLANVVILLGQ